MPQDGLSSRLGQDRDRDGRRGGHLELKPEARGQGNDDSQPDPDPESPRASRNSGKAQRRVDRGGRHGKGRSRLALARTISLVVATAAVVEEDERMRPMASPTV